MLPIHLKIKVQKDEITQVNLNLGSGYSLEGEGSDSLLKQIFYFFEKYPEAPLPSLSWKGLTPFSKKVLESLLTIPFGEVRTYKELAIQIGHPAAFRAVGSACGKNPFPFLVPCHRVLSVNGLGGFSQGLEIKKFLLDSEKARIKK